jgi:hypothetical protein
MNPFGLNLLATTRALLSQLSSATFWASMTSPIGSSPTVWKHRPNLGRPFSSISQTFDMGARIDPVLRAGVAADDLEIAAFRQPCSLRRRQPLSQKPQRPAFRSFFGAVSN